MTYTEDQLTEQPAIKLFESLGWRTVNCYSESFGEEGLLGRENRSEVVLVRELRQALIKINPDCTANEIDLAIEEITRDYSVMSDIAANQACYQLLKQGVKVEADTEDEEFVTVKVMDWQNPENNRFLLCSQLWVSGEIETRRPDLIGFVNGLPLLFIELKSPSTPLIKAYKDNLADYKRVIPQLFWFNQLIILSNGVQNKVGSMTSLWEHFSEWKKVDSEDEPRVVSLETVIRGTCQRHRLLDIVENFVVFESKKATVKIVARYHQYLGVNQSLQGLKRIEEIQGKLGVYWHTQGSGKSFSMVFYCQKAFRKLPGNWTFVIVTDRTDLDDQIYRTFNACGLLKTQCQAESAADLKQLLTEDHRFVFTLIHKFKTEQGESYPQLSDRNDVIVITDEAHRSQYSTLALNMRTALPEAGFLAFTGTPLLGKDENDAKTREVFGDYVSVYNFADAVDDGATLPLYYENRVPEVNLNRDDIGAEIDEIINDSDLTEESEARLEKEFSRAYHIITRDDRLETIAKDLVEHFMGREPFSDGIRGKAMVVAIDKATAIKMYDKVQVAWQEKIQTIEQDIQLAKAWEKQILMDELAYMQSTDMAVVVSGGQGDYEKMERKGLDYQTHRERMIKQNLDDKFKDVNDELRIVFVCAMWLTGFDAPCVSTLYLDKPLKKHTLMQTIARVNRVYPGKASGQIVDYINIFGALQEALGVYGGAVQEDATDYQVGTPAEHKTVLLEELEQALIEIKVFLNGLNIDLVNIHSAHTDDFSKQNQIKQAVDVLMVPENLEKFTAHVRRINRIFKALLPDKEAERFLKDRALLNHLLKVIWNGMGKDIDDDDVLHVVRTQVDELLDDAITTIEIKSNLPEPVNLAGIDFDALAEMLERTNTPSRADAERLKRIVELRIEPMINKNPTRIDFQQRFNEIVEQYNNGAHSAEEFFEQLKLFIDELNEEDKRGLREGLEEPELTVFDLLCQDITLSSKERDEVKRLAKDLLTTLKEALVIGWRKKQRAKARVQRIIDDILQDLPESYDDDSWKSACDRVFVHVFDKYRGDGRSVFS
ncbi:type I restriction endonuclease subunit R [Marinicella sp. S1101]|uniref:type I restriction endonuclease subunit R n=1 Tax=Marinicella marina TaxID=2996016 RepID=UPI002260E742|nr:type I restriction endonuclease subunit R [Marinicella marina]MCX7554842.1 type I restriction endonuclease subunit R [Marinicella marina]MDJ1141500.1 type I restriction endonuclease subunit R [Marinicella marina]